MQEKDLYAPVAEYFSLLGYTVRGEVMHCDLMAAKEDEIIVVELKKSVNVTLLLQALERKKITNLVYVAVPRPKSMNKQFRKIQLLLKKLELGFITVALDSPMHLVEILLTPAGIKPKNKKATQAGKNFSFRKGDFNIGGVNRSKTITAHRERAVMAAVLLNEKALSVKALREITKDEGIGAILIQNLYGWFDRVSRGVYSLTDTGRQALQEEFLKPVVEFYQNYFHEKEGSE